MGGWFPPSCETIHPDGEGGFIGRVKRAGPRAEHAAAIAARRTGYVRTFDQSAELIAFSHGYGAKFAFSTGGREFGPLPGPRPRVFSSGAITTGSEQCVSPVFVEHHFPSRWPSAD